MNDEIILELEEPEYLMDVDDDVGEDMQSDMQVIVNRVDFVLEPATTTELGGIIVGEDLQITEEGVLSVIKANTVEPDNTHPITAAAVYLEVGNINALLQTV